MVVVTGSEEPPVVDPVSPVTLTTVAAAVAPTAMTQVV
eukprot:CAMPEP_0113714822 /NCGR_PEP_ID=MMETSP0038_2-20120614/32860_1 /TAXON_ID=2898 /ORGANISM="Cryptomonas paramecium" /LENGTH=37 /DNA_ID=CAMNT_0000641901 /DNA_START=303 /DNA_END=416 /DNA_ORIENTATION=- /assembly_acc=CAM_ASM_000170